MIKVFLLSLAISCTTEKDIQVERECLMFKSIERTDRNGEVYYWYTWVDKHGTERKELSKQFIPYRQGDCQEFLLER